MRCRDERFKRFDGKPDVIEPGDRVVLRYPSDPEKTEVYTAYRVYQYEGQTAVVVGLMPPVSVYASDVKIYKEM